MKICLACRRASSGRSGAKADAPQYCGGCGRALGVSVCPSGHSNDLTARFCSICADSVNPGVRCLSIGSLPGILMTIVLLLGIRAITPARIIRAAFSVFCWYFYIDQSALVVAGRTAIGNAIVLVLIYSLLPESWRGRVAAVMKPVLKLVYRLIEAVISGILRHLRGK